MIPLLIGFTLLSARTSFKPSR